MIGIDVGQSIAISNLTALNRLKYSLIYAESIVSWEHLSFKVVCVKSHQRYYRHFNIINTVKLIKRVELY